VCRYKNKNGIQDLEKIIHYCELEIKKDERHEEEKMNTYTEIFGLLIITIFMFGLI
jgi:hypothetical protein